MTTERVPCPTPRALMLAGAAVGVAIVLALAAPGRWPLGFLCSALVVAAMLADFALARRPSELAVQIDAPRVLAQGGEAELAVRASFPAGLAPGLEAALEPGGDASLASFPRRRRLAQGLAVFRLHALRRGRATLGPLQLRWTGPLGLIWRRRDVSLAREAVVTPDLAPVLAAARALGDALGGQRLDARGGHGGEFRALRAYAAGDDRRIIDWKRSASRGALLAKEFQLEQNHPVVLAIDSGRAMVEPVDGRSRLDHALSAALALAYAGLGVGDRLKLVGFDARVGVESPFLSGVRSFAALQAAAAAIAYSTASTNYTLALHTVAKALDRRSLVVVFTEFTDTVGAELMLESVTRLARRHVVMFVVFSDLELEALAVARPSSPADISRAVVAASLLRERALVLERLKRLGVRAVETTPRRMGGAVVDAYLDLKRRELA